MKQQNSQIVFVFETFFFIFRVLCLHVSHHTYGMEFIQIKSIRQHQPAY